MKKIRSDHKLIVEAKSIEKQISELCKKMSEHVGFHVGWSDVQELSSGTTVSQLRKMNEDGDIK